MEEQDYGGKSKDYFEGTLQLRNPSKEVVSFLKKQISKAQKGVFIAREIKVKGGIDYYMSSQKFMQAVSKKLQSSFGGEVKITRKLFTVKRLTSKKVYRLTVLFRLPSFKKGDIIKVKGKEVKVKSMGRKILCADIKTGKKITCNYKDIQA